MSCSLSRASRGRRRATLSAAVLVISAATAVLPPLAAARSRASCEFQVHVRLSSPLTGHAASGTFHATQLGHADCAGTLANRVVNGSGWLDASGRYSTVRHSIFGDISRCWIGLGTFSFFASAPEFSLNNRRFVRMSSRLTVTSLAGMLMLSGTGRAGEVSLEPPTGEPLTYSGVGAFFPDRGQNCTRTPITSGMLSLRFVVTGPR